MNGNLTFHFHLLGNLYYALTHSPAPLTNEDAYALSWRAATKRLEAAGSIPEKEAELKAKALSSNEAGFEVRLGEVILVPSLHNWNLPSFLSRFLFLL